MRTDALAVMRLLEFADSTFPVGAFSFSNGIESAAQQNIVYDADTLEQFVRTVASQLAFSDGVAAISAYRGASRNDYDAILEADAQIMLFKINAEARLMNTRMGKKMAEIANRIMNDPIMGQWEQDIQLGKAPGSYPVAQAIAFNAVGLSELDLFCAHQYGVINMMLSAALRCIKVSHYDTQRILFELSKNSPHDYESVKDLMLDEMYAFNPQFDIIASIHEKGSMRMFMN